MTDPSEDRLDLSLLEPDAELRARRISARVSSRIAAERNGWGGVGIRLARFAIPALLAAAASIAAVFLTGRHQEAAPQPERFTSLVLGDGPIARWVVENRRPETFELVALAASPR